MYRSMHRICLPAMLAVLLLTGAGLAQDDTATEAPAGIVVGEETPNGEAPATDPPAETDPSAPAEGDSDQPAEDGESGPPANDMSAYLPFLLIGGFLILYIFMGRNRKKQEKQRREMLANLSKGDKVVSIGGICGTVVEVRDEEVMVKVDDNARMKFARWAIRSVGEEAANDKKTDTQQEH